VFAKKSRAAANDQGDATRGEVLVQRERRRLAPDHSPARAWGRVGEVDSSDAIRPATPPATGDGPEAQARGTVDPARLVRIASVTREVLEEARRIRPEPSAVDHLKRVHEQITQELREALPGELFEELDELTPDVRSGSLEELALAHAEILGWLQGLFQGTQLAIQMQMMRPPPLADRTEGGEGQPDRGAREGDPRYL
jgi:hypothetical protein